MPSVLVRFFLLLSASVVVGACEQKTTTLAGPAAIQSESEGPNANASRYGPHGVTQVPADQPAASSGPSPTAPPLDAAHMDMAGHPCHCGGSCHCGHCQGMIAGCHCKPKRADGK